MLGDTRSGHARPFKITQRRFSGVAVSRGVGGCHCEKGHVRFLNLKSMNRDRLGDPKARTSQGELAHADIGFCICIHHSYSGYRTKRGGVLGTLYLPLNLKNP